MPVNYTVLSWYAKVTKILQNGYFSFEQTPSVLHSYWYEDHEDLLAFNCVAFYSLLGVSNFIRMEVWQSIIVLKKQWSSSMPLQNQHNVKCKKRKSELWTILMSDLFSYLHSCSSLPPRLEYFFVKFLLGNQKKQHWHFTSPLKAYISIQCIL